jgi:hypothetical protein
VRAREAHDFLRSAAHHYGDVELISHRKDSGTQPLNPAEASRADENGVGKRAAKREVDADGFEVIKRK